MINMEKNKNKLLIIEDNSETRKFLEAMLSRDFDVIVAENGVIGLDFARNQLPHLIILDIILPILNGYDICRLLKKDEKTKKIPIIFLSIKNTTVEILEGMKSEVDDYIPKPFQFDELFLKIKNKMKERLDEYLGIIKIGDLTIDRAERSITFCEKKIELTLTEFDILTYLALQCKNVVSREKILQEIWKNESQKINDRTIDVHIRSLRKKIPNLTKHIISIYGIGYKYEP